ncbi:MAG: hypothetical protein ABI947_22230 [Chloroflexota bacterium]
MQRLPRWLIIPFNHYAFIFVPAGAIFAAILLVLMGGSVPLGWTIIALTAVGFSVVWLKFHARETAGLPDNAPDLLREIERSGKYTLLAFESEFCLASTTVGQRLANLEAENPNRFRLYSLSVLKNPGKVLFERYKGRVTPTYVLLNPQGELMMEWPMVLPIERVLYTVQQ